MTRSEAGPLRIEIAILAKAPLAGYAKTRLIPHLGAAGAADLQRWMLRRTVSTALASAVGPVRLWCAPDCTHPEFVRCAGGGDVTLLAQPAADLGARMLAAARRDPAVGTIIVGTDCPTLATADLHEAARLLRRGDDLAIVPAADGGYVLIALRAPYAAVFSDVDWGSAQVMAQTRQNARRAGLGLVEMAARWDVDDAADLRRLEQQFAWRAESGP